MWVSHFSYLVFVSMFFKQAESCSRGDETQPVVGDCPDSSSEGDCLIADWNNHGRQHVKFGVAL